MVVCLRLAFDVSLPLWVLVPKNATSDVFTEFANFGGWSSTGAACIIGAITSTGSFFGVDGVAHMAEEIRDASWTIPRIMLLTIFLNGSMGLVAIITFVHNLGVPVPVNSILASMFVTVILSLLNLGSSAAFNASVGLLSSAGAFSYMISIGCVLLKRLRSQALPPTRFNMRKLAIPINAVSVLFMAAIVVVVMFPVTNQPTPQSMNYGVVMFGGVAAIAIVYYAVHGRKVYKGPVMRLQASY
ncbi:hypothetical protein KJ359_007204 [Pestalotiopsis sp. 9143b]|nr:hypothetical protein KJ359_007204 [Pestalotiopsis sp. 9143b]